MCVLCGAWSHTGTHMCTHLVRLLPLRYEICEFVEQATGFVVQARFFSTAGIAGKIPGYDMAVLKEGWAEGMGGNGRGSVAGGGGAGSGVGGGGVPGGGVGPGLGGNSGPATLEMVTRDVLVEAKMQ